MTHIKVRDAVILTGCDERTIRSWALAGLLPTETAPDGEPLYEVITLMRLEVRHRKANIRHGYTMLAKRLLEGA